MASNRLLQLFRLPPAEALAKVRAHLQKKWSAREVRRRDRHTPSYTADLPKGMIARYFQVPDMDVLAVSSNILRRITDLYLNHHFDVLGSGWVSVHHGMRCNGLEGQRYQSPSDGPSREVNDANREVSKSIRTALSQQYVPIDWHIDFKSGYRWRADTWYQDIPYGHQPGVDIKVPWELARMHHLTALAQAYALAANGHEGFQRPEIYLAEARNQILDFIAGNPTRFGVNWRCTMDVAIRAANWLVAYDLFRAAGAEFDEMFEGHFKSALLDHGRHIMANLEWDPRHRGNHYLANVVGLLFIAAYVPSDEQSDGWLTFACQELSQEVQYQFHEDGSNFEASSAYHRLSTEMALYGTALAQAVVAERRQPFGNTHFLRLADAARFCADTMKPSGRALQIGDNDSGRFLKLAPSFRLFSTAEAKSAYSNLSDYHALSDDAAYPHENHLDYRHLLGAACGFFGDGLLDDPLVSANSASDLEREIMIGLTVEQPPNASPTRAGQMESTAQLPALPTGRCLTNIEIRVPGSSLRSGLRLIAYKDFGLFIIRSERLYLAVRCGPIGLNGRGAHAHNDQLAVELTLDGEDWISDPGSYLYTAAPAQRDSYRSVKAHFAPQLDGREPGNLNLGMFYLGDEAKARCDAFTQDGFLGHHYGFGTATYRQVRLTENAIHVTDVLADGSEAGLPLRVLNGRQETVRALQPALVFSPGYGIRMSNGLPA